MIARKELLAWLKQSKAGFVAIDDGGLTLTEVNDVVLEDAMAREEYEAGDVKSAGYIEIGGVPIE